MKVILEFDSYAEFEAYSGNGDGADAPDKPKRGRRAKGTAEVEAPNPVSVPDAAGPVTGTMAAMPVMTAPAPMVAGGGFPAPAATGFLAPSGPTPEVSALHGRILSRIDEVLKGADEKAFNSALAWLREQCGPEAAQASMDQIKQVFLLRLSQQQLESVAKQIGG